MRRSLMRRMLLSITLQIVVEEDVAVDRVADDIVVEKVVDEEDVAVDHKGEQKHGLWLHTEKNNCVVGGNCDSGIMTRPA